MLGVSGASFGQGSQIVLITLSRQHVCERIPHVGRTQLLHDQVANARVQRAGQRRLRQRSSNLPVSAMPTPRHPRYSFISSRTRGVTWRPYSSMLVMRVSWGRPPAPYFRSKRVALNMRRLVAIFWATVSGDPT